MNQNNKHTTQNEQESPSAVSSLSQERTTESNAIQIPQISLPKGGGAIKGIDEKFSVNAANGTISFGIPLPVGAGRGFSPSLSLQYNSGAGNSAFGMGWNVPIPSVSRKTDKQLPQYRDEDEDDADIFIISGAEDLVPMLIQDGDTWIPKTTNRTIPGEGQYTVKFYRPRIEGGFARIEKWQHLATGNTYWRTISGTNVTSIYGKAPATRIADPADPTRIFEWLLERSYDDKGHLMEFEYKSEDSAGIPAQALHTRNRISGAAITYTNKYLKRVRYGNQDSFASQRALQGGYTGHFLFETVFDYGEFDTVEPWRGEIKEWDYRPDAFSHYRAGFEIRTTRLCKQVLLFHHIPDADGKEGYDGLVSALKLDYSINPSDSASIWDTQKSVFDGKQLEIFTFLKQISSTGYKKQADGSYTQKSLPPAVFEYQAHSWNLEVKALDADSLAQLPVGVDQRNYALVDFYSEGIAGILTEQNDGWYYKDNLGDAQFAPTRLISPKPSFAGISSGVLQLIDLEGNGIKQVATYGTEASGFFELSPDERWQNFRTFDQVPNIDFADPNLRLIDLDGDGRPDLMLTEHDAFIWYKSEGKKGFKASQRISATHDEEKGPVLVFADQTLSIFLADMSGDGLTDLVRIRNEEICYWPNLGYGRFGAKVGMDNSPVFDHPDQFNPQYLRLADIDGSGITDILYLGQCKCRCWFNLSGNGWSETPAEIPLPHIDNLSAVTVADLMGNGTACVLWSSPLPGDAGMQMRYVDLMSGEKPHLLRHYKNNMGKEVDFTFKSSTHYYLEDRKAGTPWVTKLPFPVHCLEQVVVKDLIRDTVFANSYSYHHGYFDYIEREFRGFGRVEQLDTEEFNLFSRRNGQNVVTEEHHQPPVRTVTWFHTGAFIEGKKMLDQYAHEYYQNSEVQEHELPEPAPPAAVNTEEYWEALRAFKGMALRTETYADDGTDKASIPYSTSRATYQIRMVQPKGENQYASFLVFGGETLSYGYDRNPSDPRISHAIVLDSNELGQPLLSSSIVYPRVARPTGDNAIPDVVWDEQNKGHIVVSSAAYTNDIDDLTTLPDDFRLRVGYESKSYELLGQLFTPGTYFTRSGLLAAFQAAPEIPFDNDGDGGAQKRLSGHSRAYFLKNDLSDPTLPANRLPLGTMESLGIGYRSLQMAFTPGLIAKHYGGRVTDAMLVDARYEHSEGDANWWIPSGTAIYPADAATQFYLPVGARDPLGTESRVVYDAFKLTVVQAIDAIGNTISAEVDYRTLGPVMVTDPNGNRSAVETDELGMVVKSAVMGKVGAGEGDTLDDPTARMEYDLFNWMNNNRPNFAHTFVREQHGAANPRWQESYVYSDGSGGIIMAKAQAERGPALRWNDATNTLETVGDESSPRWIGNGRTVLNNKGNPIKQYEPYFSATHEYEDEDALVEIGVSPTLYYDPLGRNYRTDFPNGTFSKVEFDPWHSKAYDTNDTVRDSEWYIERGSPDPMGTEPIDPERRAAWLAAKHDDTPSVVHTDSLGRSIYAISDYGGGKTTAVRSETDLLGRYSRVYDQRDRLVASGFINMIGASMYGESAEKGERWIFQDVIGRLVRIWDNTLREFYTTYDVLHRPVSAFVREGGQDVLFNHTVYGDQLPDATARSLNLKGIPFRVYDPAGVLDLKELDFKGNPKEIERRLVADYKNTVNWDALDGINAPDGIAAAAEALLEAEVFTASSTYDALSRPILTILPDNTVVRPTYNEGNGLDKLEAQLRGVGAFRTFLEKQDYDAKGQRQFAEYGNGVVTKYFYDPQTFRLTNLLTHKKGLDPSTSALQDLHYHFDPIGNITQIGDDAQQTHYFRNAVVTPEQRFEYDALYQLIRATGRESAGLNPAQPAHGDIPTLTPVPHTNDANAVRTYTQIYQYDDLGNITRMQHITPGGVGNWTRLYRYASDDNPADRTNRLMGTNRPNEQDGSINDTQYLYDLHGNMTRMPHLQTMDWNYLDQLRHVDLGGGGNAWYVYSGGGQRIRKVIERNGGKRIERIYLGAVEVYRERQGNNPAHLERWTTHISDNTGRIAQVDIKTRDNNNDDPGNPLNTPLIRYQYANHLGSAVLETDAAGVVISYEEYHPYGTSAYRVAKSTADLSLKRYRFSGKERDDETGLYYFGARYYAAWLGRWTSSDPAGFVDGLCLFRYCSGNPVMLCDPNGTNGISIQNKPEEILRAQRTHTEAGRSAYESWVRAQTITIDGRNYQIQGGTVIWHNYHWMFDASTRLQEIPTQEGSSAEPEGEVAPSGESSTEPDHSGDSSIDPGSSGSNPSDEAPTQDTPPSREAPGENVGLAPASDSLRVGAQEVARPRSATGARPSGTLHLWSGEEGKVSARAAIRNSGSGWMMGDINGTPTPEHLAGEREFARARSRAPGGQLTQAEFERIWGPRSASVVGRGAFSGHPVQGHGTPRPTSIQARYEVPARMVGGGLGGGLFFGTGMFTAISGGQDPNPAVGFPLVLAGVGEATSGIIYGSGALLGSAEAMAIGSAGAGLFGGAGAAIGFGVASYRSFERGDNLGGAINAAGAAGGLVIAGAALGIVASPVLIGAAVVGVIGAGIYNVGQYFDWW